MNSILTTLAIGSVIVLGGCAKTKEFSTAATATQAEPQDVNLAVEVTVENGEMKVMVNGEERSIGDLSEIMEGIDFGGGNENIEVYIAKMMRGGDGRPEGRREHMSGRDEGHPEGMREHGMKMRGGGDGRPEGMREHTSDRDGEHPQGMREHMSDRDGEHPQGMREHMSSRDGEHPQGMREHMSGRDEGHFEGMREHMVIMMDGEVGLSNFQHPMGGEWREHEDRDIPEEHQFLEELSMLDEISAGMTPQSMVMLGIHMIRDELEPEMRLEALERIIEEASNATSRNAALIVAIETLQELDRQDEAVDLMVELVLSN